MKELLWHFFLGMTVSFVGSIPLGTVNVSVIQTTIEKNVRAGIYFAIGATIIELIYSFIALQCSDFLVKNKEINFLIQFIAIPAFVILAIMSFTKKETNKTVKEQKGKSFINGLIVGLFNPLQIPFWLAYGTIFLSNNWIKNDLLYLNVFVIGICTGTFLLLSILAVISKKIESKLNFQPVYINKIIGYIFVCLALYQAVTVYWKFVT